MVGPKGANVDFSCSGVVGGLSKNGNRRMAPCFWADAVGPVDNASNSKPAAASARRSRFISCLLFYNAGFTKPAVAALPALAELSCKTATLARLPQNE